MIIIHQLQLLLLCFAFVGIGYGITMFTRAVVARLFGVRVVHHQHGIISPDNDNVDQK